MSKYDFKDEEIKLDPKKYIVSKTDKYGIITFCNDYFVEISKYDRLRLIGSPHSILRHPDMPKIIFKLMWDRIQSGKDIIAVVKNLANNGQYYWVMTDFETTLDPITNKPIAYTAYRKAAPKNAVDIIEPIYKELIEIEKYGSIQESEVYLKKILDLKNHTYDTFIDEITNNKGLVKIFFKTMKKLFKLSS